MAGGGEPTTDSIRSPILEVGAAGGTLLVLKPLDADFKVLALDFFKYCSNT